MIKHSTPTASANLFVAFYADINLRQTSQTIFFISEFLSVFAGPPNRPVRTYSCLRYDSGTDQKAT